MALAVGRAITDRRPLIVQAGTGTGKSLAYLVPAVVSGAKVVVATATKALQDQLAGKDLPFLAEHVDRPFTFAVLKGRSNYVCRQRVHEATDQRRPADPRRHGRPVGRRAGPPPGRLGRPPAPTGDRAELDHEPSPPGLGRGQRRAAGVPGRGQLPAGRHVLRRAGPGRGRRRRRGGGQHPPLQPQPRGRRGAAARTRRRRHRRGPPVRGRRVGHLRARAHRRPPDQPGPDHPGHRGRPRDASADLEAAGTRLAERAGRTGRSPPARSARSRPGRCPAPGPRPRRGAAVDAARACPTTVRATSAPASNGPLKAAGTLVDDIDWMLDAPPSHVVWVEGTPASPVLKGAPIDVAEVLKESLWQGATVVLTSATIPAGLGRAARPRTGIVHRARCREPVRLRGQRPALLRRPPARSPLARLRGADARRAGRAHRGGRRAHAGPVHQLPRHERGGRGAAPRLLGTEVLTQNDLPKPALMSRFTAEESTSLFATMGFWQGIDVPGPFAGPGDHRPPAVPPTRRAAAAGPPRAGPGRRLPAGRPAHGPPRCWPRARAG